MTKLFKSKKSFALVLIIILVAIGILLNPTLTIIIFLSWLIFTGARKAGLQKRYMNIMEGIKNKLPKFK